LQGKGTRQIIVIFTDTGRSLLDPVPWPARRAQPGAKHLKSSDMQVPLNIIAINNNSN